MKLPAVALNSSITPSAILLLMYGFISTLFFPLITHAASESYAPLVKIEQRLQRAQTDNELVKVSAIPLYDAEVLISRANFQLAKAEQSLIDHYIYLADLKLKTAYVLLDEYQTRTRISELKEQRDLEISKFIAEQSQQRANRDTMITQLRRNLENSTLQTNQQSENTVQQETARGTEFIINGLGFDQESNTLLPDSQFNLQPILDLLQELPDRDVIIEAHTSNKGTRNQNLVLSQQRANSIRDYFINRGVTAQRISTLGSGENFPLTENNTAEGRKENERIEIILKK